MGWIVASALLERDVDGLPYPCLCEVADPDPPGWKLQRAVTTGENIVYLCDPYLSKRGRHIGQWLNRCACWGSPRIDEHTGEARPDGCCAWSVHNPAYAPTTGRGIDWRKDHEPGGPADHKERSQPIVEASTGPPDRERGDHPHRQSSDGPEDIDEWDYTLDPGPDDHRIPGRPSWRTSAGPVAPYVRRWLPQELTCRSATPWDSIKDARQVGYHCTDCHRNFKNQRAAVAHQKLITDRCKDPGRQLNVDGRLVYRAVTLGSFTVWQ
jgi:hypothetical protein